MKFYIITTQPTIYDSFLKTGLIARGIARKIIDIKVINWYDFGLGAHHAIDDTPYGGGPGMILRFDVVSQAISKLKTQKSRLAGGQAKVKTILLTPQGKRLDQKMAKKLMKYDELILISGRFEGYDERIRDLVDYEISIGDYVLTAGDLPAMVLIDAISRQIPGFIEKKESLKEESFNQLEIENSKIENCLEFPQYTRPENYQGKTVPKVLLSGNHAKIKKWRQNEALKRTYRRRPDLI